MPIDIYAIFCYPNSNVDYAEKIAAHFSAEEAEKTKAWLERWRPNYREFSTADLYDEINWLRKELRRLGHTANPMAEYFLQDYLRELKALYKELYRRERVFANPHGASSSITPSQVEAARSVPIEAVLDSLGIKIERRSKERLYAMCPFHNEDTPSFVCYIRDGSYHCFGCKAGGDTIRLVMMHQRVAFKDAILFLLSLGGTGGTGETMGTRNRDGDGGKVSEKEEFPSHTTRRTGE